MIIQLFDGHAEPAMAHAAWLLDRGAITIDSPALIERAANELREAGWSQTDKGSWMYPGENTGFIGLVIKKCYEQDIQGLLGNRPWAPSPVEDVLRSCSTEIAVRAKIQHATQVLM